MKRSICLWQQPALLLAGWCLFWEKPSGEIFFSQHCLLVLLQMCMRKFLQESVRKHLRLFFVTSIIPLIPGSTLYYCMNSILEGNTVRALEYGRDTFLFAFGIAAGMSIAWSICYFLRSIRKK